MELVDAIEVLGLGDQQQLGVAARADEREALQQVPVGEVLARGRELALVAARACSPSSRRHAGSSFRNVYLTKCRALICADYRSRGAHAATALGG